MRLGSSKKEQSISLPTCSVSGRVWLLTLLCASACDGTKIAGGKVDGPTIYEVACQRCHGQSGEPSASMVARSGVKPLTSAKVVEMSDAAMLEQIRSGSKNRMMPGFEGGMSEEQMVALVAYIRTFAAAK